MKTPGMVQFAAILLRGVIATFTGLLVAGGTLTLAADRVALQRPTLVAVPPTPDALTVPQVTGQAYVFAKGILEDGGFAWHVTGPVQGFAANTVVDQDAGRRHGRARHGRPDRDPHARAEPCVRRAWHAGQQRSVCGHTRPPARHHPAESAGERHAENRAAADEEAGMSLRSAVRGQTA